MLSYLDDKTKSRKLVFWAISPLKLKLNEFWTAYTFAMVTLYGKKIISTCWLMIVRLFHTKSYYNSNW